MENKEKEKEDEFETPIFQFPNLQMNKIENDIKSWKKELKDSFIKKGFYENLNNELYQVLERSNCWNVKPEEASDNNLGLLIYNKLKDDTGPVKDLIKEQIQNLLETNQDLRNKMKKKIKKHIESISNDLELENDPEIIKEKMKNFETLITENKKDKKVKTKKKQPPQEVEVNDEVFITCGQVNSRGKPCLRRRGTCPYHNK